VGLACPIAARLYSRSKEQHAKIGNEAVIFGIGDFF
jgi:hypothetical protein